MGRELRRREEKKSGKKAKVTKEKILKSVNPYDDIYKMLKNFGIILLVIIIIYFLVATLITKELDWFSNNNSNNTNDNAASSNIILAKNSFMQSDSEYYVYYYDFTDTDATISTLIRNKLSDKVYKVNTSDAFNANYVSEEVNLVNNIEEFKVSNPTIIRVVNGTIETSYVGRNTIIEFLEGK